MPAPRRGWRRGTGAALNAPPAAPAPFPDGAAVAAGAGARRAAHRVGSWGMETMPDGGQTLRRQSTLKVRNVRIGRRRTSLRLETAMWDALQEVADLERITQNELLTEIAQGQSESSFTASVRVFTLNYFRALAGGGPSIRAAPTAGGD